VVGEELAPAVVADVPVAEVAAAIAAAIAIAADVDRAGSYRIVSRRFGLDWSPFLLAVRFHQLAVIRVITQAIADGGLRHN